MPSRFMIGLHDHYRAQITRVLGRAYEFNRIRRAWFPIKRWESARAWRVRTGQCHI